MNRMLLYRSPEAYHLVLGDMLLQSPIFQLYAITCLVSLKKPRY